MTELNEKLFTPKELDEKKIISLVQQWKERERGRLKCYRIGRKILYGEQHITDFLKACENKPNLESEEHIEDRSDVAQ